MENNLNNFNAFLETVIQMMDNKDFVDLLKEDSLLSEYVQGILKKLFFADILYSLTLPLLRDWTKNRTQPKSQWH